MQKPALNKLKESTSYWFYNLLTPAILTGESTINSLKAIKLFPLPCNGVLCKWNLQYVHPTCLHCRTRRRKMGKYIDPPYWINYTYQAFQHTFKTTKYLVNPIYDNGILISGQYYTSKIPFEVTEFRQVRIDPRGKFLHFRISAIQVIDAVAFKLKSKPNWGLAELCEFLANYPT